MLTLGSTTILIAMMNCLLSASVLMTNNSLVCLIAICLALFVFIIFEIREVKILIEQSKTRKDRHKKFYENLLIEIGDTRQIFNYFLEIKEKLPEKLHNKMIANCLNNDYYAKHYVSYIDAESGDLCKDKIIN